MKIRYLAALPLTLASLTSQAEFANTSYSYFGAGAEVVNYQETIDDYAGMKVKSNFSATNISQRSGGYTAIDDKFGFFIRTASTLIAEEDTEDWKASGFDGHIQNDTAAMNFQMLDISGAYHLGNGGYWLLGLHYQKVSFSRFDWRSTDQTEAFADSIEDYIRNTPELYDPIVQGINNGTFTDAAGNVITTEDEYFAATRFDPEDTMDVVFEDASSFSLTAGFEYDSYFKDQSVGLRYLLGGHVGINLYENVLNSGNNRALTRNFGGGVDVRLTAGVGYQFRPEVGAMLVVETNASWRDGIRERLGSSQTIELPDNEFYSMAMNATVYWNF